MGSISSPHNPTFPHSHLQVEDGLQALQEEHDQLFKAWSLKQERLQAMLQEQCFLRQCDHLAETLTAQEAGLAAPALIFPLLFLVSVCSSLSSRVFGFFLFYFLDIEQRGYG